MRRNRWGRAALPRFRAGALRRHMRRRCRAGRLRAGRWLGCVALGGTSVPVLLLCRRRAAAALLRHAGPLLVLTRHCRGPVMLRSRRRRLFRLGRIAAAGPLLRTRLLLRTSRHLRTLLLPCAERFRRLGLALLSVPPASLRVPSLVLARLRRIRFGVAGRVALARCRLVFAGIGLAGFAAARLGRVRLGRARLAWG